MECSIRNVSPGRIAGLSARAPACNMLRLFIKTDWLGRSFKSSRAIAEHNERHPRHLHETRFLVAREQTTRKQLEKSRASEPKAGARRWSKVSRLLKETG